MGKNDKGGVIRDRIIAWIQQITCKPSVLSEVVGYAKRVTQDFRT